MVPLLLLPLVLAQTHDRWEASLRTETRARTALAQDAITAVGPNGQPKGDAAGDLELRGQLSGAVFNGPWTLSGGYTPTLWVREPYLKTRFDHAHVLQLDASWAREGKPRVFLDEYANYGTLDLTTYGNSATVGTGVPAQPPGTVPLTTQFTSDTQFGVDWPLARDLLLTTLVGYTFGGGVDEASQVGPNGAILPLQSSPRAAVRLAWGASRRDTFTFNLTGQYTSFKASSDCFVANPTHCYYPGAQVTMGELSVRYVHLLAERTSVDFTAGLTAAYGQLPDRADPPGILPLGEAGISHRIQRRTQRWDFRLSALGGPYVDRFRGTVYERIEGNGNIGWGNGQGWFAYVRAGVSQSFTGVPSTDLFTTYGEAGAGYQGAPWWRVDLYGREALLRSGTPAGATVAPPFQSQWIVGLSLTLIALSAPQSPATE